MDSWFNIGGKRISVEQGQPVIKITKEGKGALAGGLAKGLAFDILSQMSDDRPHTTEELAEKIHQRESMIKHEGNVLIHQKFIEII